MIKNRFMTFINSEHIRFLSVIMLLLCTMNGCNTLQENKQLTYLALGDSFTIGELVPTVQRWPVQLANSLNEKGLNVTEPIIIARTGWRSDELIEAVTSDKQVGDNKFDIVSLLIGVNNQYQGKDIKEFPPSFEKLMNIAIKAGKKDNKSVFVLSIPDYSVTPFGKPDAERISREVAAYNKICEDTCNRFNVPFYDITDISRRASNDLSLLAEDKLHPSGKMYTLWVDKIIEDISERIGQ